MSGNGVNPFLSGLGSLLRGAGGGLGKVLGGVLGGTEDTTNAHLSTDFTVESKNLVARLIESGEGKYTTTAKGKIVVEIFDPSLNYIITGRKPPKKTKTKVLANDCEETENTK